jgi:hypothetical protein
MKKNRNLRFFFLVLFAFAVCLAGESGNAQTKNAKKTAPPSKTQKSTAADKKDKKETSKTTAKNDSTSKSSKSSKAPEKSKNSSSKEKTASAKDKRSDKKTSDAKSKTSVAKNTKPANSKEKAADVKKPAEKTSKSVVKTTAKTNVKPIKLERSENEKSSEKEIAPQIIVNVTSARVRSEPALSSSTVTFAKLGSLYPVLEQTARWYKVRLSNSGATGWISMEVAGEFDNAKRDAIYNDLIKKYYKEDDRDFPTSAEVFEFLTRARDEAADERTKADLSFKRFNALRCALKAVPSGKSDENPYREFLEKNDAEIIYSEPSAEWLVRANLLWELHKSYAKLPIAEEIAWQAANNPIPGECEGYTNCYIYLVRVTSGEYLNFYPDGKYSREALKRLTDFLEPIASDAAEKKIYAAPTDTSDRKDFNQLLTELRGILSKLPYIEKNTAIAQVNKIAEGYR